MLCARSSFGLRGVACGVLDGLACLLDVYLYLYTTWYRSMYATDRTGLYLYKVYIVQVSNMIISRYLVLCGCACVVVEGALMLMDGWIAIAVTVL